MEKLEMSLILAAIEEGAENPSNKGFSTKDISEKCGVSEFTLFTLFKTKDNLVKAANDYIMNSFVEASKKAAIASKDVESYIQKLIYYGFSKPLEMEFLANYGLWNGKVETDPDRIKEDHTRSIIASKEAFHFLKEVNDEDLFLIWSFVSRHINYFVLMVYDGILPDSPAYRDRCAKLLAKGVSAFANKEAR